MFSPNVLTHNRPVAKVRIQENRLGNSLKNNEFIFGLILAFSSGYENNSTFATGLIIYTSR